MVEFYYICGTSQFFKNEGEIKGLLSPKDGEDILSLFLPLSTAKNPGHYMQNKYKKTLNV